MVYWLLYTGLCLLHLGFVFFSSRENPFYLASKVIPIFFLLGSLVRIPGTSALKIFGLIALLFSSAGDAFLALPGKDFFVPGLGSFLVAQVLFGVGFGKGYPLGLSRGVPFLLFGVAFYSLLYSSLGSLAIPVLVYTLAICFMGWRAATNTDQRLFLWGAVVFIGSDATIAITLFLFPEFSRVAASFLIMTTYYLAQGLFTLGLQKELARFAMKKS